MANILTYSLLGVAGTFVGTTINVELPYGTVVTALIATFTGNYDTILSEGIAQVSGVTQNNFTSPIAYVVNDGTDTTYTVTVTIAENTDNKLVLLSLEELFADAIINNDTGAVELSVNSGTDVTGVVVTLVVPDNAVSSIASGSTIDLSSNLALVITSESLVSKNYIISVIAAPDHTDLNYTIFEMVLNRLPFLENTLTNKNILSQITLELMFELEACFKVSTKNDDTIDTTRIGKELYYSMLQKSILADMVSVSLLTVAALRTVGGDKQAVTEIAPQLKYIKSVVAGSVEVQWDAIGIKDKSILAMNTEAFLIKYSADAKRKLIQIGCPYALDSIQGDEDVYVSFVTSGRVGEVE